MANKTSDLTHYDAELKKKQRKTTLFPQVAGILTIVGSCIALALSLIYLSAATISQGFISGYINSFNEYYIYYLTTGIFGAVTFPIELASGILALRRKRIAFSIFGSSLLAASGSLMARPHFFFGLPIFVLALLSVLFLAISKAEFRKPTNTAPD